jgi:hypothetical protein
MLFRRKFSGLSVPVMLAVVIAANSMIHSSRASDADARPARKTAPENPAIPETSPSEPAAGEAAALPIVCVDSDDNPVARAEVYMFQYSGLAKRYRECGPFETDAEGKATCNLSILSNDRGNYDRWIYARLPGKLVGVARCTRWTGRADFNPAGRVQLMPSQTVEGQVTVPAGVEVTKVTIRIRTLHVLWGDGFFDYDSFPRDEELFTGLHTALPQFFDRHPGPDGRIRFDDMPKRGNMYLVTTGPGLAEAQWRNANGTTDQQIVLNLAKESPLRGHVLRPDGMPAAGLKVSARLESTAHGPMYLSRFAATTDENGDFALHGLPQLQFVLSVKDPKKRWTFPPMEHQLAQPDEDRIVTLKLQTGTLVSGQVVDPDGKPVHSAGFSAIVESQSGPGLDDCSTDENGRYQFRLPAGKARLYFNSLPDGFAYPDPQTVKQLDIQPDQPDLENLNFIIPFATPPAKE